MTGLRHVPYDAGTSSFGAPCGTDLGGRAPRYPDMLLCEATWVILAYDRYDPERLEPINGGVSCPIAGW